MRRHALWLSLVIGTLLSGLYWCLFLLLAFGVTAGDYMGPDPWSDEQRRLVSWLIGIAGFAGYGVLAWIWRRIDFRLRP